MYLFKNTDIKINKTKASKIIGCDRSYLSLILNRKRSCTKRLAYFITKYLDAEKEILDYFDYEEGEDRR